MENKELLESLGVNLSTRQLELFSDHLFETLKKRISESLSRLLDEDELSEFMAIHDEEASVVWIKQHIPNYQAIVQDEFDILMGEIAQNASALSE